MGFGESYLLCASLEFPWRLGGLLLDRDVMNLIHFSSIFVSIGMFDILLALRQLSYFLHSSIPRHRLRIQLIQPSQSPK